MMRGTQAIGMLSKAFNSDVVFTICRPVDYLCDGDPAANAVNAIISGMIILSVFCDAGPLFHNG
jgi:hypothetical protein